MTTLEDLNGYLDDEAYTIRVGELRGLLSASIAHTAGAKAAQIIEKAIDTASRILRAGGDYGDELSDAGLRRDLKAARDDLRSLLAATPARPTRTVFVNLFAGGHADWFETEAEARAGLNARALKVAVPVTYEI